MVRHPTVPSLLRLVSFPMVVTFILLATVLQLAHGLTIERPPQAPHVFNDTVESVEQLEVTLLAAEKSAIQQILDTVSLEDANFDNTILPYVQNENIRLAKLLPIRVYDSGDLATAANEVYANVSNAVRTVFASEPYFALVDHLYQANPALSEEDEIVLKDMWNKLATSGLSLAAGAERDQYLNKLKRIEDIQDEFFANLDSPVYVYFTAEELDGVSPDTIRTFDNATGANAGKLQIDILSNGNLGELILNSVNETTRLSIFLAYERQAPANVPLVQEMIQLRFEVAQLFNFSSWTEFAIQNTLAANIEAVEDFIADLRTSVAPLGQSEQAVINDLKSKDERLVSPVGEKDIAYRWDKDRYANIERKTTYAVNDDEVKAYFPANVTVPAILDIYAQLYGLRFDRVTGQDANELSPTGKGSDLVYHPDVAMYAVWDNEAYRNACNDPNDSHFRGWLYVDIFQRPGKDDTGFEDMFVPGYYADGRRQYPSVQIVLSLPKSRGDEDAQPTLIQYHQLASIFHELGHGTHDLVSITTYARTHGTSSVPTDFIELPSQFMENYARVPEAIKQISKHWSSLSPQAAEAWRKEQSDPDAPLPPATMPDDLIAQVIKGNDFGTGFDTLASISWSRFDQDLYQLSSLDAIKNTKVAEVYNKDFRSILAIPDPSDLGQGYGWGNEVSTFGQIVEDLYAGLYYSYQWCLVRAEDVFYTAFYDDPFNSAVGWRYRQQVLQPGSSKNVSSLLPSFLGREPNNEGYYRYLVIASLNTGGCPAGSLTTAWLNTEQGGI
ncbi:unnamed protein product [Zymoseptoria tritici ST99CH_1A5]|uniref:Peptidase M3A/M3B catalytic domain-containing protein n=1 Tax=Zymoseptoria tritici ST99CH_1A5 TaxID=1276529 RepID=A0A1Y6LDJ1_ZYMTR|nr:unnamed protein product [Zymoseptoria tritici ST99CH_1A5]